jgi:tetratricopeptide (TPR) repeat protein
MRAQALRGAGFDVTSATDAASVSPAAPPNAAIVLGDDGSLPVGQLLEPLTRLNGRRVFVVSDTDNPERRVALEQAGAEQVLKSGPDVPTELARLLALPDSAARVPAEETLAGEFEAAALVDLIRVIGERPAVITCTSMADETGTVWLRDGRIVDVQLGWLPPVRALGRLFTWKEGRYVARVGPHQHEEALALDAVPAAQEALRRADMWHRLVSGLGGLDAVYRIDYVTLARRLGDVPDESNALLRLIDGERTVRVLADALAVDELQTLALALRLRIEGILVPAGAALETAPATTLGEAAEVAAATDESRMVDFSGKGEAEAPGLPQVSIEAIDQALSWVAGPSAVQWSPPDGPIPVVHFPSRRGGRTEALDLMATNARLEAAARNEEPLLLTDEVLPPGANATLIGLPAETTEILVSAPGSPLAAPDRRSRSLAPWIAALLAVVGVVALWRLTEAGEPSAPTGQTEPVPTSPPSAPASTAPPAAAPVPPAGPAAVVSAPPSLPSAPAPVAATAKPSVGADQNYSGLLKAGTEANVRGHAAKAIPLLEQAVAIRRTAAAYVELGKAYDATANLDRAIASFQRAAALEPKSAAPYMYLGSALQEAHRLPEAKTAYERFLALEPADSPRHAEIESVLKHL